MSRKVDVAAAAASAPQIVADVTAATGGGRSTMQNAAAASEDVTTNSETHVVTTNATAAVDTAAADSNTQDATTATADTKATATSADTTAQIAGWTRGPCPSCNRSYKFYCPKCCITIGQPPDVVVPALTLPLDVHIWFQDKIKKSTAPHAKVLAPQDVAIVPYPLDSNPPDKDAHTASPAIAYTREDTVVVYPSIESETLAELSLSDLQQLKRLVFIDCPWQKAPIILQDPAIAHLRCVKLAQPPLESKFWRYHTAGKGCVSTIEAIALMLEEFVAAAAAAGLTLRPGALSTSPNDLLFFFQLLYSQISDTYDRDVKTAPPMSEAEKERQRVMHDQREAGRKRRLENKHAHWRRVSQAIESGEISERPRNGRCFNCKQRDHEAKQCPQPCRYCKATSHWSGVCPNKHLRHQLELKQQVPITKAL